MDTVKKTKVSMKDVADRLGVSKATVSRALSGKSEISLAMRQKVATTCEELGYRLNPSIQDLVLSSRSGNTRNIGYVLVDRDFSDPAYAKQMDGIAKGIAQFHYNLMLVKLTGEEENVFDLPPILRDGRIDGVLVSGNLSESILNALRKLEIEIVVLGVYSPAILKGLSCIQINIEQKAYRSIEIARDAGCKRVALFEESPKSYSNSMSYQYIKQAVAEYGLSFPEENYFKGEGEFSGASELLLPIFARNKLHFDVIICWDYRTAQEIASLVMGRCGLKAEADVLIITSKPYSSFRLPVPALYLHEANDNTALAGVEQLVKQLENTRVNNPVLIKV